METQLKQQSPASKQGKKNIDELASSMEGAGKQIENATEDIKNFDRATDAVNGSLADINKRLKESKKEFEQCNLSIVRIDYSEDRRTIFALMACKSSFCW